jgi:hypothetical protein
VSDDGKVGDGRTRSLMRSIGAAAVLEIPARRAQWPQKVARRSTNQPIHHQSVNSLSTRGGEVKLGTCHEVDKEVIRGLTWHHELPRSAMRIEHTLALRKEDRQSAWSSRHSRRDRASEVQGSRRPQWHSGVPIANSCQAADKAQQAPTKAAAASQPAPEAQRPSRELGGALAGGNRAGRDGKQ